MITWDSELCDYKSNEFSCGFTAGKAGLPSSVMPVECVTDVQRASWLEGWLMGDSEREVDV